MISPCLLGLNPIALCPLLLAATLMLLCYCTLCADLEPPPGCGRGLSTPAELDLLRCTVSAREKRSEVVHYSTVAYRSSSASQSSIANAREGAVLRAPRGGPGGERTGRLLIPSTDVGQGVLRGGVLTP